MRKLLQQLMLIMLFMSLVYGLNAQISMLEKDYEISRKAKKGYLGNIESQENGNFNMIFILPSSDRKIKTETYRFDPEANLLGIDKDEMEVEKARKKWKWFNYKGEYFIANNISASANMTADLVFRKKLVTAKYNWWTGKYVRKVKMLDKLKPKNEEGKKYKFFGGAYEVERDSSILVMAVNATALKEKPYMSYELLKSDNQLNIQILEKIEFPYSMTCVFSQPLKDDYTAEVDNDDYPRDWILIYAPTDINKKTANKNPRAFEYLRITPEGRIAERAQFEAPVTGWRIVGAYAKKEGVLIYGMGTGKADDYVNETFKTAMVPTTSSDAAEQAQSNTSSGGAFGSFAKVGSAFSGKDDMGINQDMVDEQLDLLKYTSFVFTVLREGKITGKVTTIDEVNDKATCPPDMKKPLSFDGKMFTVRNIDILNDNTTLLSIQDFKKSKSDYSPYIYKGLFLLHFKEGGELITNYTLNIEQKDKKGFFNNSPLTSDMVPASSAVYEGNEKNKLNWILHVVKAIDKDSSSDSFLGTTTVTTTYTPLYSIEYGSIDLQTRKATEFKSLGEDADRKFYLFPSNNVLESGNYLYFFSETTRGDRMLISRLTK